MQQVELFLHGERDYGLIKGSTGPIVCAPGVSRVVPPPQLIKYVDAR